MDWEKQFDEKFTDYFNGYGGIAEVKEFIRQTILDVLEEAIGEKEKWSEELMELTIDTESYIQGYNKKRSEILDLKNKYK